MKLAEDTRALLKAALIGLVATVAVIGALLAVSVSHHSAPPPRTCTVYAIPGLQDPQIVASGAVGWYYLNINKPPLTYICENGTLYSYDEGLSK